MYSDCRVLVCCSYRARLNRMLTPPTNTGKSVTKMVEFRSEWTYEIRRSCIDLQGICLTIIPDGDVHSIYSVGQTSLSVFANKTADMRRRGCNS